MSKARQLAQKPSQPTGRKNLIINGAMNVAQRDDEVTSITSSGYKTVDRFSIDYNSAGTWTMSQEGDGPDGFANSMKLLCTTAKSSLTSSNRIALRQRIEGQDLQNLKKGTSNARAVTLSFWCKSNKTGTYVVEIYDYDNSRHINKSFSVSSSATWEYKTITFDGDTTGTLDNDNSHSFHIQWWLAASSVYTAGTLQTSWGANDTDNRAVGVVNLADTVNNYFQITGVQLEVGSVATEFEHRSYGEELALCQRYFYKLANPTRYIGGGSARSTTQVYGMGQSHPNPMRATPTAVLSGTIQYYRGDNAGDVTTFAPILSDWGWAGNGTCNAISGMTDGQAVMVYIKNQNDSLSFDAEL